MYRPFLKESPKLWVWCNIIHPEVLITLVQKLRETVIFCKIHMEIVDFIHITCMYFQRFSSIACFFSLPWIEKKKKNTIKNNKMNQFDKGKHHLFWLVC